MKKIKYPVVLLIVIALASCNDVKPESKRDAFAESTNVSQACFDRKMEQWYSSFQKYQSNGYDMATADAKAVSDALLACESCMTDVINEE